MTNPIYGETTTLKSSQKEQLSRLYKRRLGKQQLVSQEFATHLTLLSGELNRIVACLVDRAGRVEHVMIGDAERVFLPDLGRTRAKATRFRGVRLIRTSLSKIPSSLITPDDHADLNGLQLDAVVVLQVGPGSYPGYTHWIHLIPPNPDGATSTEEHARIPADISLDFEHFISELEAEFQRKSEDLTRITGEPAILIHVDLPNGRDTSIELNEFRELARTANVYLIDEMIQRRPSFHPKYGVGVGKLEEIERRALQLGVDLLIFTHDLLPRQLFAISERTDLRVIDRTQLILDIFASHATTADAKIQVELAQLKYNLPKISIAYSGLSRLTGGIGGRGPGETKLELNKRRVNNRLRHLESQIAKVSSQRELQRSRRNRTPGIRAVSIVGYTNAGKSTLLNRLTHSDVLEEDKLFATLRPTSRHLRLISGLEVIFTDTVGFIHDLPPELVNAFKATLEELKDAELLLHVVDISSNGVDERINAVHNILRSLDLDEKPQILIFNKSDLADKEEAELLAFQERAILISASTGEGIGPLLMELETKLKNIAKTY